MKTSKQSHWFTVVFPNSVIRFDDANYTGVTLPRVTTATRGFTAPTGTLVFNDDIGNYEFYNGIAWVPMGATNVTITGGFPTAIAGAVIPADAILLSSDNIVMVNLSNSNVLTPADTDSASLIAANLVPLVDTIDFDATSISDAITALNTSLL